MNDKDKIRIGRVELDKNTSELIEMLMWMAFIMLVLLIISTVVIAGCSVDNYYRLKQAEEIGKVVKPEFGNVEEWRRLEEDTNGE